jgi:hypothetical protein
MSGEFHSQEKAFFLSLLWSIGRSRHRAGQENGGRGDVGWIGWANGEQGGWCLPARSPAGAAVGSVASGRWLTVKVGTALTRLAGDAYSASVVRALRDAWPLRRAGELAP